MLLVYEADFFNCYNRLTLSEKVNKSFAIFRFRNYEMIRRISHLEILRTCVLLLDGLN